MTLRSLDAIIKVSFACIMIAILIPELGGHSGEPVQVFVMLAGFVGVAAAGFWRARLVRLDQSSRAAPPRQSVGIPVDEPGASQAQNRLRDLGLIAFLVGLFVLLVSFAILFSAPPQPRLATAGGILTALGAAGLAFRYRFFAVLVACFLAPIAVIAAFVVWPPIFWVFLAAPIALWLARRWLRAVRPRSSA